MTAYPTPAAVRTQSGAPSLTKMLSMARGGDFASLLEAFRVPLVSAALIVLVGAIGVWLRQPWLFAGLAPTILMVAASPGHDSTSFRAIVVGHIVAIACAYLALLLLDGARAPNFIATRVTPYPRIWASALALAMLAIVQPQFRAFHPPAGATALLVTMGAYKMTGKTPLALTGAVIVIAIASEMLHRVRPRRRG
jgi:hypothetical protein